MPYKAGAGQQRTSTLPAVEDVHYSKNVFANSVEVALWRNPELSVMFSAGAAAGPFMTGVDIEKLNAVIAGNGPNGQADVQVAMDGSPENGRTVSATGANAMPGAGQVIGSDDSPIQATPTATQSGTPGAFGSGYQALVKTVNAGLAEGLRPNKPWKSANPGTGSGTTVPSAPNKPSIMQCYVDSGFSWIKSDGTHWCAAYVTAVLNRSGLPYKKTLRAVDYVGFGGTVADPKDPSTWRYNDIMVIGGHVCFIRGFDPTTRNLLIAGGNQGQDLNECLWGGATYFNQIKSVSRAWPTSQAQPLPTIAGGRALTKVATHGGTSS